MEDRRPDPLGALQEAANECGVSLPDGLLKVILQLEAEPSDQEATRSMVQARLRSLIETAARDLS
jgi:hypothetical protein